MDYKLQAIAHFAGIKLHSTNKYQKESKSFPERKNSRAQLASLK